MHELQEAQGDVVCLQELQFDHYEHYLLPFMFSLGYESIFTQKSRDSQGMYGKVDGCATFWKRSKFVMLENYDVEFNEVARRVAAELGLDEAERRRFMNKLSKDNIAQLVVLDTSQNRTMGRGGRTAMCVVNTHLYANKNQPEVKLWQTLALMNEVESFIVERDLALIMCGDFNSEPTSSVYEFLAEAGIVNSRSEVAGSEASVYLPDASSIVHNLDVTSVMYSAFKAEPQFTNYTANYKGTLDYIWYTPGRIRVMACTAIPEEKDLLEFGEALPNSVYPSDHLMICCDVALSTQGSSVLRNPNRKNGTTALVSRGMKMRGGMR
jgi:CCR4-NOT transcription complex subunit 6